MCRVIGAAVPATDGPVHLTLRAGLSAEPRNRTGVAASVIGLRSERRVIKGAEHDTDLLMGWDKTIESATIRQQLRQPLERAKRIGAVTPHKVANRVAKRFREGRP